MENTNGVKAPIQNSPAMPPKRPPRMAPAKPAQGPGPKKPRPASNDRNSRKTGLLKAALAMIVPAALVGAAIYGWQKSTAEKTVAAVRQEARETEMSFEERLRNIKDKLTGVEGENEELKKKAQEAEKLAAWLDKAKIDFTDSGLGLAFTYPAAFGDITVTKSEIASGTKYIGTFSGNDQLFFGGISRGLAPISAPTPAPTDTGGFAEEKGKYYFLAYNGARHEISPAEAISLAGGGVALLLDKNSFAADPAADGLPVAIGDNVAAVANLEGEEYPGVAFLNSDFSQFPLESFKEMVRTIKSQKNN